MPDEKVTYQEACKKLEEYGQQHVLKYYDELSEEQKDLAESNKKHEKPMKGWQEITDILAYTENNADYYKDWVTASEIHNAYLELRTIHPNYIGRVLKKMNIDSKVLNGSTFRYFPMPRIWKR